MRTNNLNLPKGTIRLLAFLCCALAVISCTTVEIADLPPPMENVSSSSDGYNAGPASSSSSVPFNRSSSSECVGAYCYTPSSSSAATSSSSVVILSSSSVMLSSSSITPSSSSSQQQSSSSVSVGSDLCAGFTDGTQREHYGKNKPQFCDPRDGNKYVYVTIGTGSTAQVWMAENLNYNATGSVCYSNSTSNCDKYSKMYNWAMAMNGEASSTANPSGVQGICPTGWHLPSDAEWDVLVKYVDPNWTSMTTGNVAGTKLKAKSGWNAHATYGNGTDYYGFAALPSGYGLSGGFFSNAGSSGLWWSTSEASRCSMDYNNEYAYRSISGKTDLHSVRCVKD